MKLIFVYLEEDYKHIPAGKYPLDNEFNVLEFNTIAGQKKIVLEKNINYHHPFNDSLNNISCIVGKNGIGKTTFFELIIAPLLWRLDGEILSGKIHLLFYDEIEESFYIESYINNARYWHLWVDGVEKEIYKNIYTQNDDGNDKDTKYDIDTYAFSVMPFQMNIIFHSLSPFDRIYDLLKLQLSTASSGQVGHYHKRLKYIGIKQIENDETSYEYMTLINLISVLLDEKSQMMFSNLGYEYGKIEISIENDWGISVPIPQYNKFKKENRKIIESLFTEDSYAELEDKLHFNLSATRFNDLFFKELLFKSVKIDTQQNFLQLLHLVSQKNGIEITPENVIDLIYEYLKNLNSPEEIKNISNKELYEISSVSFKNKEHIVNLNRFGDNEYLKEVVKDSTFLNLLKYIKKLAIKGFVSFKMNLYKNGEPFDYLRLSSGEKTLLSYFANILGRIRELDDIQAEDSTYSEVKNKTYLILIDEVELHLHPEWQRNFIKQLNDFFTYEDNSKRFQFVIATHSPFVVTDIYDDNIVYLGGKPDSKTFGGNIFDIFKDDFYVSNSIGAFSEDIIKDLSEVLYVLFAMKKGIREKNYFMIRDYFDLMYETDDKEQENADLTEELGNYLRGDANEKFIKISNNRFIPFETEPFPEIQNIIHNIGEDVIQNHLQSMLDYLRD
jgi:predicted ATP-binding protein involved in virulence